MSQAHVAMVQRNYRFFETAWRQSEGGGEPFEGLDLAALYRDVVQFFRFREGRIADAPATATWQAPSKPSDFRSTRCRRRTLSPCSGCERRSQPSLSQLGETG